MEIEAKMDAIRKDNFERFAKNKAINDNAKDRLVAQLAKQAEAKKLLAQQDYKFMLEEEQRTFAQSRKFVENLVCRVNLIILKVLFYQHRKTEFLKFPPITQIFLTTLSFYLTLKSC